MTKKKIGLVLSGGATHGFAQIGAIKILEEKGIVPDLIVGCSVGSLIGAALASGKSIKDIEEGVKKKNIMTFLQPNLGTSGLIKSEKIVDFVLNLIHVKNFEDLKTKLIVNASELKSGKEIIFEKGDLKLALSASISIPGLFVPIKHEHKILVDGGFNEICPIHLAKDVDIIILIDVSDVDFEGTENSHSLKILAQSIVNLQQHIVELTLKNPPKDVDIIVIRPDVSKYSLMEIKKSTHKEMIKLGEEEATKVLNSERSKKLLGL
ncbi:MAG: patatin-like phospholipase family protein [Candidatus Nanoarchaeia archaeon]